MRDTARAVSREGGRTYDQPQSRAFERGDKTPGCGRPDESKTKGARLECVSEPHGPQRSLSPNLSQLPVFSTRTASMLPSNSQGRREA